jgi:serine protease SohB
LFLAQAVTIVLAIVAIITAIAAAASKSISDSGEIEIEDISTRLQEVKSQFERQLLNKDELKQLQKDRKSDSKKTEDTPKPRLFVVDFEGDTDAEQVSSLREEITAILTIATPEDEVLVKVESAGGVVHGYGLAASQLMRIKQRNIPLTIAVDKVAASGGYMMACVADKILAAPFAIIGSIGVVAGLPNFNRLLKKHEVDYELFTAGEFKRTVTMFGENSEKAKQKFNQELEDVHVLFKDFVTSNRESLDIDKVATGEHWYGTDALTRGLVDELQTSDDYQMSLLESHKLIGVKCEIKKGLAEKLGLGMSIAIDRTWSKWMKRSQSPIQ